MKTRIFIIIGLLLLYVLNISNNKAVAQNNSTKDNTILVVSSPEFYILTEKWINNFSVLHPDVKLKVIELTDNNSANILNTKADFYFVSNEIFEKLDNDKLWKMKVGEDALIPIMNSKNPFLANIKKHNISTELLAEISRPRNSRIWYDFPETGKKELINYYKVQDQSQEAMISRFLSVEQTPDGVGLENNQKLISAVQTDPYSLGFCKLSELINSNNDKNITILPIDINQNGTIDDFENVYTDLETFLSKGKFKRLPQELTETIYSVALQAPTKESELAFLKYISTNGQHFTDREGFAMLSQAEKHSNLKELGFGDEVVTVSESKTFPWAPYLVTGFILLAIIAGFFLAPESENKVAKYKKYSTQGLLSRESLVVPTGLYFDKSHTWAFMEKDGLVGVGIDDFLQHVIGPVTKINMKETGSKIKKGESFLSINQDGKQLCLKAPISGTIKSQNKELLSNSELLNNSPYEKGWVYMIEPSNWLVEIQFLSMWKKYNDWLKNEFTRLKEFLNDFVKPTPEYSPVLQDGGELKDGVLTEFGPEIWEDFQENFIDKSE